MEDYKDNLFAGATGKQFEYGRALRQNMTTAEFVLWEKLRGRRLSGFKFRRQHPIDKYIADFYCHEARLVIEVDGGIHTLKMNAEYDVERNNELGRLGITTIRFTNEEVIGDMANVLEKILGYLTSPRPSPHGEGEKTSPRPSPQREGEKSTSAQPSPQREGERSTSAQPSPQREGERSTSPQSSPFGKGEKMAPQSPTNRDDEITTMPKSPSHKGEGFRVR